MPRQDPLTAPSDVYLTSDELAGRHKVSIKTVYHWRLTGVGPQGTRFGRQVRYSLADVRRWERQRAKEDRYAEPARRPA